MTEARSKEWKREAAAPGVPRSAVSGDPAHLPWASWPDAVRLSGLLAGTAAAAIVPASWDARCANLLAKLSTRPSSRALGRVTAVMAETLAIDSNEAFDHARLFFRMRAEDAWWRLRTIARTRWRPRFEMAGLEHIRQGQEAGHGVLLWVMGLCGNSVFKQALHDAGVELVHLSRRQHGAARETRLGLEWLGPCYRRAENPFLAGRIVMPLDGSLGFMRQLASSLESNACVSIMAENEGRQTVECPVLGHPMRFATGAPALAWKHGSRLLPVATVRKGPLYYAIEIEEPIPVDAGAPRREFVEKAVREFARRLEVRIRRQPSDWQGWLSGRL